MHGRHKHQSIMMSFTVGPTMPHIKAESSVEAPEAIQNAVAVSTEQQEPVTTVAAVAIAFDPRDTPTLETDHKAGTEKLNEVTEISSNSVEVAQPVILEKEATVLVAPQAALAPTTEAPSVGVIASSVFSAKMSATTTAVDIKAPLKTSQPIPKPEPPKAEPAVMTLDVDDIKFVVENAFFDTSVTHGVIERAVHAAISPLSSKAAVPGHLDDADDATRAATPPVSSVPANKSVAAPPVRQELGSVTSVMSAPDLSAPVAELEPSTDIPGVALRRSIFDMMPRKPTGVLPPYAQPKITPAPPPIIKDYTVQKRPLKSNWVPTEQLSFSTHQSLAPMLRQHSLPNIPAHVPFARTTSTPPLSASGSTHSLFRAGELGSDHVSPRQSAEVRLSTGSLTYSDALRLGPAPPKSPLEYGIPLKPKHYARTPEEEPQGITSRTSFDEASFTFDQPLRLKKRPS